MSNKNPIIKKYNTIAKIYNQIWVIAILLAVGLFIMQIASGNIDNQKASTETPKMNCYETPDEDLITIENYQPKTNSELTIIEFDQIVKTKLKVNEIPPVNNPQFTQDINDINKCVDENEEVIIVTDKEITKIYPIRILRQHLVINDKINELPILVSYCALCNSPVVYSRELQNNILEFGTTGLLYKNNDLFYDNVTDSLWSQLNGVAVVGDSVGQNLTRIDFKINPLNTAMELHPDALIMNFDTGFRRNYMDKSIDEFATSDSLLSETKNTSDKFNRKDTVYVIKVDNKIFAINSNDLKSSNSRYLTPERRVITAQNTNGIIEISYQDEPISFSQSFWYVWFDFYPETIALTPETPTQ